MKKIILGALVLGAFLLAKPTQAAAPNVYNSTSTIFYTVATGPGSLFSIHITSGAAGDYAVCYDSAAATGFTGTTIGTLAYPELMRVFVSSAVASVTPGSGAMPPAVPVVIFNTGLVCGQNVANRTNIYYRQPN